MTDNSMLFSLLAGMQLTDSALPTGAFAHSFGFETYLESGQIHDPDTFASWLEMFTDQQLTFTDALTIRLIYAAESFDGVREVDALVTAQALPRQVREAGMTIGRRLLTIGVQSYPSEWAELYQEGVDKHRMYGHPACVWAVLARSLGIDEDTAVTQHNYATIISLTQNAVRAIPLGQNAGQRIIRQAQEWVVRSVEKSRHLQATDLGAIAPGLEIAQINHERQLSRLFMS